MRNLIFTITITCVSLITGFLEVNAQEITQYENLLEKNVRFLDENKEQDSYEDVLFRFERLRKLAPEKWLPSYYSAYCKLILTRWRDDKEDLTNQVIIQLEELIKKERNSENITLLARAYMKKVEFNETAGPKYTVKIKDLLKESIKKDNNNPRTYLMYGHFYYYFPEFAGGDKEKALKFFKKAKILFNSEEEAIKKKYSCLPHWGKKLNINYIENYKN